MAQPGTGQARGRGAAKTTAAAKPAAAAAADTATEPEPGEHEQEAASTIELLDEDNRLEQGAAQEDGTQDGTQESSAQDGSDEEHAGAEEGVTDQAQPQAPGVAPDTLSAMARTPEQGGELFPSSPGIDKQKAFWIEIFTHFDSSQGVLHDGRIALPVYDSLDLSGMRYREQRRYVTDRKRQLSASLRALAAAVEAGEALAPEQQALRDKLPPDSTPEAMREFAENVRFQRGLADRFRDGLIASGALLKPMRAMLARHGVPEDLVYLPHVESSFNNATLSKFGAAGIWQFTRGTGRLFMKVGYEVDERLDPIIASEAAAKFLRQNYERLGTWPLAITAYNHGPQSLERIVRRMGTRDLGVLIQDYDGRLFKFASKNFYAEFLAAREIAKNYRQFFGPLELERTLAFEEVTLPWFVGAEQVADALEITVPELRRLNPALRQTVWSGSKYIPAAQRLRIPADSDPDFLASVPEDDRHDAQKRSVYVRVARGDTLYSIGRRHGISWRAIALANNIGSARRLLPGQKLILPWDGAKPPPEATTESTPEPSEEPARQPVPAEQVLARIPVDSSAPWKGGKPTGDSIAIQADEFQELRLVRFDPARKEGELVAAYGETVGKYARWANVTPRELRRLNGMSSRSVLRPGETYVVPLDAVSPQDFDAQRRAFHREREQTFFAEYDIKEKVRIEVRRGQSPWMLAQDNNVPMWLFYRENPQLLTEPMRAGMEIILPVVQAGARPAATQ